MLSKILLGLFAAAVVVSAQDTTTSATDASPTAGISACILACIQPAAQLNNCTFTDPTCVCASAQFQADATACLTEHCTSSDLAAAVALQTQQCTAAGISASGTATAPNSIPFTLAGTSTDTTGSSTGAGSSTTTPATTTATSPTTGTAATTAATGTPTSAAYGLVVKSGPVAFVCAAIAAALVL